MPTPAELEKLINSTISVKRIMVITAKEYIFHSAYESLVINVAQSMERFLSENQASMPDAVIIHPSVDIDPQVKRVVDSISWQLSFTEAVWSLIHSGFLMQNSFNTCETKTHVEWTTVYQRSGGRSAGWRFTQWEVTIPAQVRIAPSYLEISQGVLSDADIYVRHLNIPNLHPDVREALEEAIRCFRADLYTPCLAMLGKAVEGAITEVGLALVNSLSVSDRPKVKKLEDSLMSEFSSIAKKISAVNELYEKQDLFGSLVQKSGVRLESFRGITVWADHVRESRNLVHYGSHSSTTNNYEKAATLLLSSTSNFKALYSIITASEVKSR